jgi:hypothetical protein
VLLPSLETHSPKKEGGSLTDFAESRFGAVAEMEFYSQKGDESHLQATGHDFIIREYQGTWPDETEPTYYVVACGELDRAYVSLTVTTSPEDFQKKQKTLFGDPHISRVGIRFGSLTNAIPTQP